MLASINIKFIFDSTCLSESLGDKELFRSANILQIQCCQLSWLVRETPALGAYLLVSRLEDEISRIITEFCHFFSDLQ